MKCAICSIETTGTVYLITRAQAPYAMLSANVCNICMGDMVGKTARNRIDVVLVRAGWAQEPLPPVREPA